MIVDVEKMSYGPDAIAHLESGKVVFIPFGVPGDRLDIELTEEKPRMARGRIKEIIAPSEMRIPLYAPDLLESLAPWEAIDYSCSLEQKRMIVRDALLRVGHLDASRIEEVVAPVVACKQPWGYRNKLEFACMQNAKGKLDLGFHGYGSTCVEPVSTCPLGNDLIKESPKKLTGALRYALGDAASDLFRVGVRGSTITRSLEVALWTVPGKIERAFVAKALKDALGASSLVRIIAKKGSERRVKKLEVLSGSGLWKERIAGCTFKVSAPSFFQVNTAQAEKMVELVMEGLGEVDGKIIADLYCGVGTFSVPLAKRGADLLCIELAGSSTANLAENLASAGAQADIICDDVERVLPELRDLDAIVVDPPRAGLAKPVIERIAASGAQRLVYVSCDPQTLARDIAHFESRGAQLERCTPVDMFPQTYHIECVCELSF